MKKLTYKFLSHFKNLELFWMTGHWTWFKLGWQTGDEGLTFKSMFNTLRFIQIFVISYRSRVSILTNLSAFLVYLLPSGVRLWIFRKIWQKSGFLWSQEIFKLKSYQYLQVHSQVTNGVSNANLFSFGWDFSRNENKYACSAVF